MVKFYKAKEDTFISQYRTAEQVRIYCRNNINLLIECMIKTAGISTCVCEKT